jgi:hypothetical protein
VGEPGGWRCAGQLALPEDRNANQHSKKEMVAFQGPAASPLPPVVGLGTCIGGVSNVGQRLQPLTFFSTGKNVSLLLVHHYTRFEICVPQKNFVRTRVLSA